MATARARAVQEEALDSPDITFEFDGEKYTVSREMLKDLDVLEGFEDGKAIGPIKTILGPSQWDLFRKKKRNIDDLGEMAKVMFDAIGVDPGELSG